MIRGAPLAALKSSIAQMVFTVWTLGKPGAAPVGRQRLVAAVIQRLRAFRLRL